MTSPTVDVSCLSCLDLRGEVQRLDRTNARLVRERDEMHARLREARLSAAQVEVVRAARGLVATWDDPAATEDVVVAAAERLRAAVEAGGGNGACSLTLAGGTLEGVT